MKKLSWVIGLAFIVAGAFLAGSKWGHQQPGVPPAASRKVLYYVDPMNPAHTSDQPGLAPCGMKMEPVFADDLPGSPASAGSSTLPPGTVRIIPEKQQLIGVRLGTVEKHSLTNTLRLLGKVALDETRLYRINATVDGWVTKALPIAAGSPIKKNETLATFYSPEFLSAGQALLFALSSSDRVKTTGQESPAQKDQLAQFAINLKQYTDSLKNLGMGEVQIEEMIRTRHFMENVDIVSPVDGFIAARNVSQGQRFDKGTEFFRIIDLSKVWIVADLFEREARLPQAGLQARISLPGQSPIFTATLSDSLPQFDTNTRTVKLRFEAENPDYFLKPDMFVDVEISSGSPATLVVPADAVLDAGRRKTVFVDRGGGSFEPRAVRTGRRAGDQVEILQGLMIGERIAVSGNFLIDSESRMKLAAAGVSASGGTDPVCGMAVDKLKAAAAGRKSEYQSVAYYFCNDGCKQEFDAKPAQYLQTDEPQSAEASLPSVAAPTGSKPESVNTDAMQRATPGDKAASARDLVCDMVVNPEKAKAAGRFSETEGVTCYFCSKGCKAEFDSNPAPYLAKANVNHPPSPAAAPSTQRPAKATSERDQPHH